VIEGTIDLHYRPTTFYGKTVAHNYVAKVDATVKDGKGALLGTISFQHDYGESGQVKQEQIAAATEQDAIRFLVLKVFKVDPIASNVSAAKKDEFNKFIQDEQAYYDKTFSDATKHEVGGNKKQ
jgi:hypothetical protein